MENWRQREDYWMKTLPTVYPNGLDARTKFMNKDPLWKLFHHSEDMVNVLLVLEQGRKQKIMIFPVILKFFSTF